MQGSRLASDDRLLDATDKECDEREWLEAYNQEGITSVPVNSASEWATSILNTCGYAPFRTMT